MGVGKIHGDGTVAIYVSDAQALAIVEHQRLCPLCSAMCKGCKRYHCCAALEKLVEGFARLELDRFGRLK